MPELDPAPVPETQVAIEELPRPRAQLVLQRVLALAAGAFGVRYLWWRFAETDNPAHHWFYVVFLVAEAVGFLSTLFFLATTWRQRYYRTPPPLDDRSVDVFITTYDEPGELLRDTIAAALAVTYPHRTLLLDDGDRAEVAALARDLGCEYIGRASREHAKAGNLNNGLSSSRAEFVVTLDADHVPRPTLVDELIGFFREPSVAIVQANQDCYNLDSFQHEVNWRGRTGWQMQELFFNVIQPGKDVANATIYCGSPAMLRRAALDSIGGFATGTITEDLHTGMRLQKRGWRVLYHNVSVARGLAPQTFVGYAAQWRRWGVGSTQVLRLERPLTRRGLTPAQRFSYLASYEYNVAFSYVRLVSVLTVVFAAFTGIFPLLALPFDYASHYLPYLFANLAVATVLSSSWRTPFLMERYNFVKIYATLAAMSGYFQRDTEFRVTPKSRAPAADFRQAWLYVALLGSVYAATLYAVVVALETRDTGRFWAYIVTACFGIYYFAVAAPGVSRIFERRELRTTYRFPQELDLDVAFDLQRLTADGRAGVRGRTFARNVNRSGLSVTLDESLHPGTFARVTLSLPDRAVVAFGQVAWTERFVHEGRPRYANGIRFLLTTAADGDAIMRHMFLDVAPKHGRLLTITAANQPDAFDVAARAVSRATAVVLACATFATSSANAQNVDAARADALAEARAAAARGDVAVAIARYDDVLRRDSLAVPALREVTTLLEGRGEWERALPYARRLARALPTDPIALFRLGQWLGWTGAIDSSVAHLRRAVALAPDSSRWTTTLGEILTWRVDSRNEGSALLRAAVARDPHDEHARRALAAVLSWSPATRRESITLYRTLVAASPTDVALLDDAGDVLSWSPQTREEATRLYARAQRLAPTDRRAARGRLNVLTWSGRTAAARRLADSLLATAPSDTSLQRVRASLLRATGRPRDAVSVLRALLTAFPEDSTLREQLAYALLAAGDARAARTTAASLPRGSTPAASDWVRRATAPAVGIDVSYVRTSLGLELFRLAATASAALPNAVRVGLVVQPTTFSAPNGDFRSHAGIASIDVPARGAASLHGQLGVERYDDAPTAWSGELSATTPLSHGGSLHVGARRSAVEDSRRAARGVSDDGVLVGQVRANSLFASGRIAVVPGTVRLDASFNVGAYTGRRLRTNARREGSLAVVRSASFGGSTIDAGLGVSYLSFLYDANRPANAAPSNEIGGYWSPRRFGNAFARLGASQAATGRLTLRADASLGRLMAGRATGDRPFNVAASGEARWIGRDGWDLTAGALYLDNLATYQARQFSVGVRHAF